MNYFLLSVIYTIYTFYKIIIMLTPFQWTVISFLLVQSFSIIVATIKLFMWVVKRIDTIDMELKENSKRDKEMRIDIQEIKKEDKGNYQKILDKVDGIIQGLVTVEADVKNINKQLDKL